MPNARHALYSKTRPDMCDSTLLHKIRHIGIIGEPVSHWLDGREWTIYEIIQHYRFGSVLKYHFNASTWIFKLLLLIYLVPILLSGSAILAYCIINYGLNFIFRFNCIIFVMLYIMLACTMFQAHWEVYADRICRWLDVYDERWTGKTLEERVVEYRFKRKKMPNPLRIDARKLYNFLES
jgi:hypothetical protein